MLRGIRSSCVDTIGDGLVLTNLADHVIKLHLRLVTDHFFQNDEFLHSMFSVWGSRGSVQGSQAAVDPTIEFISSMISRNNLKKTK